jgi:hypothetical protein
MLVFVILFGGLVGVVGYGVGLRKLFRRPTEAERAAAVYRRAHLELDDVFDAARIHMEEAAGKRRRGERRLEDGLRGSWRYW